MNQLTHSTARWLLALAVWLPALFAGPTQADECGLENGRPCGLSERIPSCNLNLIENNYRCEAVACGKQGVRPCSAMERTVWDYFLKAPAPLPCDVDLVVRNGVCVRLNCGGEGQGPCTIFDRIPSCNINLVEEPGRCTHPDCGREGQLSCITSLKRKLACDATLVKNSNGICVRPGSPDGNSGSHGSAPVGTNTAPPPPPPRPPVPPPASAQPPQPANTGGSGAYVPPASTGGQEIDTDRMGNDIYGFPMTQADPAQCQSACNSNTQCQAWTYVKPGIKAAEAYCFLKNPAPAATPNSCCVSGAKAGGMTPRSLIRRR